jgi:hypothetical protein
VALLALFGLTAALILYPVTQPTIGGTGRAAAPTATPNISSCVAALTKDADPRSLSLGQSAQAALAISITCAARLKPVDLVILADESNSMVKDSEIKDPPTAGTPGGGLSTPGGPINTPEPTKDPGGSPGGSDEPSWCSVGSGSIRVTDTPTPRRPPRRTATPGLAEPTAVLETAGGENLIKEEQSWVKDLLDQEVVKRDMASDRLRIGFYSFNATTRVKQSLTNDPARISSAAARLRGDDVTRINAGMRDAERALAGTGARVELGDDGRVQIIALLSDFEFCQKDIRSGGRPDKSISVITVGIGRKFHQKNWRELASDSHMALKVNEVKEAVHIYDEVLAAPIPVSVAKLDAHDQLSDNMGLVAGSVQPVTATIAGQLISWSLDPLKLPWTLGYAVVPADAGTFPLSADAGIEWIDSQGLPGSAMFPNVDLEVIPYTATPEPTATDTAIPTDTPTVTPSATPTATATRTPAPGYLPMAYKLWPEPVPTRCVPELQTIDMALVIDTSTSMSESTQAGGQRKLDAAIAAAIELVKLLKPADQATVIGFNATATMAQELTGDKTKLIAALQSLAGMQASGTAIDQGLAAGFRELTSVRHLAGNSRSLVLVTDGAQTTGAEQLARDQATAIKAAGIQIVTVGLGAGVEKDLLKEIATGPDYYFDAPNAEGLVDIYRSIARLIPCP